jgi:thioredoxin reductase (NADPH)
VRARRLGVPGERELAGRGVHGSATKHARRYAGARAVVVGGGDAAVEEALILAREGAEVTVVHRRDELSARHDFRARAAADPHIRFVLGTRVEAIEGAGRVERVRLVGPDGPLALDADAVFPCVGVEPNNELVADLARLDALGYIVVDERQRTSTDWIYAAGDVTSHSAWSVAAAVGQGAAAVKDISRRIAANP